MRASTIGIWMIHAPMLSRYVSASFHQMFQMLYHFVLHAVIHPAYRLEWIKKFRGDKGDKAERMIKEMVC